MTKEDKELLFQDLCARLPYGVVIHIHDINVDDYDRQLIPEDIDFIQLNKKDCKPYLRPMSSMTEEEKKDFLHLTNWDENDLIDIIKYPHMYEFTISIKAFDWLNKNYFDYRGLIPKGLAIEVTEKNNPYKWHNYGSN
jgi:hypothetical protein